MKHAQDLLRKTTKVLCHRRNSVKAMLAAVELEKQGIAGYEYDVVGTKDSVPFLMHDRMLTRALLPDGKYVDRQFPIEVSALTADELRQLRPDLDTLKEALEAINKKDFTANFEFHLEIKSPDSKLVENILAVLKDYPKIDRQTSIRSFQESVLQQAQEANPDRNYCLLLEGKNTVNPKQDFVTTGNTVVDELPNLVGVVDLCGFRPDQISVQYKIITPEFIDNMAEAGIEVEVYTLNDITGLKGMVVDRITTDEPIKIHAQIGKPQKAKQQ